MRSPKHMYRVKERIKHIKDFESNQINSPTKELVGEFHYKKNSQKIKKLILKKKSNPRLDHDFLVVAWYLEGH